jgi:mannosyltransferase
MGFDALVLFALVALVAAYAHPLMQSLWVDETGTLWMARGGAWAALQKTWHWPGQSVLYAVIESFFCFEGSPLRDTLLRLPSLLGAAVAAVVVYRFAEDLFGKGAGRIAAAAFAFNPLVIQLATEARPYALALAAAAASCWTLYRWTRYAERKWLVAYVFSSALVIYLHYMFVPVFCAHAVLIAFGAARVREFALAGAAIAVLALPLAPHMALLLRESHTLPFAPKPQGFVLAELLMPAVFAAGLFASGLLLWLTTPEIAVTANRVPRGVAAMLLILWSFGPILFFEVSRNSSMQMFVPRYLSYSGLGLSLLLAGAGFALFGGRMGFVWVLLGSLLGTASPLALKDLREPGRDELAPAMNIVRAESAAGSASLPPVFFRSELPESDFYNWRAGNAPGSYLFAPFVAYPMRNELLPLPYGLTAEVKAHVAGLLATRLKTVPKVILITHEALWIPWFQEVFERAGYSIRWTEPNNFYVVVFERKP